MEEYRGLLHNRANSAMEEYRRLLHERTNSAIEEYRRLNIIELTVPLRIQETAT